MEQGASVGHGLSLESIQRTEAQLTTRSELSDYHPQPNISEGERGGRPPVMKMHCTRDTTHATHCTCPLHHAAHDPHHPLSPLQ